MLLNESIGRTLDLISIPKPAQKPAHQRGLAGAKVAFQIDDKSRRQYVPQLRAQLQGGGFVDKRKSYRFMIGHG